MMIFNANPYSMSDADYDLMVAHAESAANGEFDTYLSDWKEDAENLYGGEDAYIDSYWESLCEMDL